MSRISSKTVCETQHYKLKRERSLRQKQASSFGIRFNGQWKFATNGTQIFLFGVFITPFERVRDFLVKLYGLDRSFADLHTKTLSFSK